MSKIMEDGVVRDMTEAELAQLKTDKATANAQAQADKEKAQAKADVIRKLVLTADVVSALLS